jgi:hypothetical protein
MAVWAFIAARTRVLTRMRSPLDWLPNRVMARSWGFASRVDRPADLRYPQLHPEVVEDGEGERELVAVEGAPRLADHHRVEPAVGVAQRCQQLAGLRPSRPGQRPAVAAVEELRDDRPIMRSNELAAALQLRRA